MLLDVKAIHSAGGAMRGDLAEGTVVGGDFEIVSRLAGGGMGEVYVARQRSTGYLRALKRVHGHLLEDDVARARFEREAKVIAKIESMHVAQVIAAGVDERGDPFIAMELLRGTTLSKAIKEGPFEPARARSVMLGIGHALAAAHRAGVVHRDIKPENVMLTESQMAGVETLVKVVDFGIAMVASGTLSARMTGDLSLGTPPYMAPEQFEDSTTIGPHTDVWAMGLVMFAMLTGRSFWRTHPKSDGAMARLIQEIVTLPLPPSAQRAAELDHPIDSATAHWIDACLQRFPALRFRDGAAAYNALLAIEREPTSRTSVTRLPMNVEGSPEPPTVTVARAASAPSYAPQPAMIGIPATIAQGAPPMGATPGPPSAVETRFVWVVVAVITGGVLLLPLLSNLAIAWKTRHLGAIAGVAQPSRCVAYSQLERRANMLLAHAASVAHTDPTTANRERTEALALRAASDAQLARLQAMARADESGSTGAAALAREAEQCLDAVRDDDL